MLERRRPFRKLRAGLMLAPIAMLLSTLALLLPSVPPALASRTQLAIFQEDTGVMTDPVGTLQTLRSLGAGVLRVTLQWSKVAPAPFARAMPAGFDATDPGSPAYNWGAYDQLVRLAQTDGIALDLSVTGGAPLWATGGGKPAGGPYAEWRPDATQYGRFVQAVGARYSGSYTPSGDTTPLPRVNFWEVWNEPNFGPDLAPQAVNGSRTPTSAPMYRRLVDTAWVALNRTGHGSDTIVLGNLDARGQSGPPRRGAHEGFPGNFAATKPALFVRELYCVDSSYRPLRGSAARGDGCPANPATFRGAHPGLFKARGFGDHPYPFATPPDRADTQDADQAEFTQLPHFAAVLDRAQRVYHSSHRFAIYDTEYGYITNPPNRSQSFPSPALAAVYINEAEYLSWLNPRLASTMQFLLQDPNPRNAPEYGGFASGLEFYGGKRKPGYAAYRLPIYLPASTVQRGARVLVWGCARPAQAYGNHQVKVQFQAGAHGAFTTVRTVTVTNPRGYFTVRVPVGSSGVFRLAWSYPGGATVFSRSARVRVR